MHARAKARKRVGHLDPVTTERTNNARAENALLLDRHGLLIEILDQLGLELTVTLGAISQNIPAHIYSYLRVLGILVDKVFGLGECTPAEEFLQARSKPALLLIPVHIILSDKTLAPIVVPLTSQMRPPWSP
jgi:hypothetical protein